MMEYISGKSLDALIPPGGLRLNVAVKCGLQIAEAMCAAHRAGIVHRDLKPANVMVSDSGLVKILDFGLAKAMTSDNGADRDPDPTAMTALTMQGNILGTAPYMSPEQAEGGIVDGRTDIFAFGCIFYEMLTGVSPFKRDSAISSLSAVLRDQPKPRCGSRTIRRTILLRCGRQTGSGFTSRRTAAGRSKSGGPSQRRTRHRSR